VIHRTNAILRKQMIHARTRRSIRRKESYANSRHTETRRRNARNSRRCYRGYQMATSSCVEQTAPALTDAAHYWLRYGRSWSQRKSVAFQKDEKHRYSPRFPVG
jgi:hypothetical protein